jgi:hypothetical protein
MHPRTTIEAFDRHLATLGLSLEAVVVGGSALALLEIVTRETRDFDILAPDLPAAVSDAARAFAASQRSAGSPLRDDWLNNGPKALAEVLPPGWREHVQPVFRGTAVTLDTLGRTDLLKSKLFALCDRGFDRADCLALAPSAAELTEALPWVADQDAHPGWPDHVAATFADLAEALGHAP